MRFSDLFLCKWSRGSGRNGHTILLIFIGLINPVQPISQRELVFIECHISNPNTHIEADAVAYKISHSIPTGITFNVLYKHSLTERSKHTVLCYSDLKACTAHIVWEHFIYIASHPKNSFVVVESMQQSVSFLQMTELHCWVYIKVQLNSLVEVI